MRFAVPVVFLAAVLEVAASLAVAQENPPPADLFRWSPVAIAIGAGVVVVIGIATAVGVRMLEAQRRRDSEASSLQSGITELLQRDPRLAGLPILPVVQVPRQGPATLTLSGQVPSEELRRAAVEAAQRETRRLPRGFTVQDRLAVVPGLGQRRAAV